MALIDSQKKEKKMHKTKNLLFLIINILIVDVNFTSLSFKKVNLFMFYYNIYCKM
jgi:hypothetical protein